MEPGYIAAITFLVTSGGGSIAQFLKARTMLVTSKTQAVSWLREIGLVLKDISGLWYAAGVGHELIWIAVTHALSCISSTMICCAKFWVQNVRLKRVEVTCSHE